MKKQVGTIDLTPTPEAYVNSLLLIIENTKKPADYKWAKEELVRAMTIAMGVKKSVSSALKRAKEESK